MDAERNGSIFQTGFFTHIILPALLTICLFVITLFFLLIPAIEKALLDRKREMIRELVNTAWSVLSELEAEERQGNLPREEAQRRAIDRIRLMRYGAERKDYFWITTMQPQMVVHPYLPELNGQDLSNYQDPKGKNLFVEFVKIAETQDEGYTEYMWQWKDDETRIVPKLSFVKRFEPWSWIIGTGIYLEDVRHEIATITRRLILVSISITAAISLLLLVATLQSHSIERRRRLAESGLRASREKYKSLVEATTEGLAMVVAGNALYANQTLLDMLGYQPAEILDQPVERLISDEARNGAGFMEWLQSQRGLAQIPVQLNHKNGGEVDALLTASSISFSGQDATVLIVKDVTRNKTLENELDQSQKKYEALTNTIHLGVFRATMGKKGKIIEANQAVCEIFGFSNFHELSAAPLAGLVHDADGYELLLDDLARDGSIRNRILRIRRHDGATPIASISASMALDRETRRDCYDAVIEDITAKSKSEAERDDLIAELQTSLLYMNQPVRHSMQAAVACGMNTPIQKAAALMTKNGATAILIQAQDDAMIGIVTDRDIRERSVSGGFDPHQPVFQIMSSPLISISDRGLIFEAALLMHINGISHLAAKDSEGKLCGMVTSHELLHALRYSSAILIQEIQNADSLEEIIESRERLPQLVKALLDSGAKIRNITRTITTVSDTIAYQVISQTIKELGPPPAPFAFVALGSEGREEQTLSSDQDNAIVFADSSDEESAETQAYFLEMGRRACAQLNQAGYAYCPGDVMAMNERWTQPLSTWKQYFSGWIGDPDPQALLDLKIFFDFRLLYGEEELVDELTRHIQSIAGGKAAFYQCLAANTLLLKPPLGMFGNIVLQSKDGHSETFNSKEAMMPITDFARIYALQKGIRETNTPARLQRIVDCGALAKASFDNAMQAYEFMMRIRLNRQTELSLSGQEPTNHIHPKSLTEMERSLLKKALANIAELQSKLKVDFTGTI